MTRARQAAEALFAPKWPIPKNSTVASPTPADASAHKPRVLSISPPPVARETIEPTICPAPRTAPMVPKSQVARIRTWVKYGMTVRQTAEVTGVDAGEIERVLQRR